MARIKVNGGYLTEEKEIKDVIIQLFCSLFSKLGE